MMFVKLGAMLTDSSIMSTIKNNISPLIFEQFDTEFYMNIIHNESLMTYSSYYPMVLEGIPLSKENAIPEINPVTGKRAIFRYKIPNRNPTLYTYIGIYDYYCPGNDVHGIYQHKGGQANFNTVTMIDQLMSLVPHVNNFYTVKFEFPDMVTVNPVPPENFKFVVSVNYKRNLSQIDFGHFEMFKNLVVADTKIAIYNLLPNLQNSGNFGGIEIETIISKWDSAKEDRNNVIEKMEADWFKDPVHMRTTMTYQNY